MLHIFSSLASSFTISLSTNLNYSSFHIHTHYTRHSANFLHLPFSICDALLFGYVMISAEAAPFKTTSLCELLKQSIIIYKAINIDRQSQRSSYRFQSSLIIYLKFIAIFLALENCAPIMNSLFAYKTSIQSHGKYFQRFFFIFF